MVSKLIPSQATLLQITRFIEEPFQANARPPSLRKYHERNNGLISQYLYIDRLLDSSLPHNLIEEYNEFRTPKLTPDGTHQPSSVAMDEAEPLEANPRGGRIKRTAHNLYRIPDETTPLFHSSEGVDGPSGRIPDLESPGAMPPGDEDRVINLAIRINFIANVTLLASKIAIMAMTSSMSMLAGLVDGVLDFLSTVIIWVTTIMIRREDRNRYPISRRRLEPISVLIFSVIMVTSFFQVALSSMKQLIADDHRVVELSAPSIALMGGTVLVKLLCWLWCRLIPSPSVQVLAQDAMTDVVFNTFSIIFPLIGTFANLWYLDPLGGLILSCYIMWNWGQTAAEYIRRLTGAAASADDHSILLYMTMRFSRVIHKIQNLKAYYASDKLNVEVDLVLDEGTSLRDSHDVGESLQYILESVPTVDRAFVHLDYDEWNLPSHMNQMDR
ncbi:Cation efflux protein [Penicillium bovifimosum]|uniref:Cation efflux protein n=1 Tax=Penicillium bovifimosum TaxID=126998 RepID=A0A9W9LAH4_9EURO|nr:Cation efflux protein [Penicillium bovifimosum]KAJ5146574.1 Cation efflux protein [Penicillium bovifimosum]